MQKVDPKTLKVDWPRFNRIVPSSVVSSKQLSEILGVHLQTIANWRLRSVLPEPIHSPRLNGNKIWYRCAAIRAWLHGTDEETETRRWIDEQLDAYGFTNSDEAMRFCGTCWRSLQLEKPIRV